MIIFLKESSFFFSIKVWLTIHALAINLGQKGDEGENHVYI
jgi:hypothetical protein